MRREIAGLVSAWWFVDNMCPDEMELIFAAEL
jgi:hypothetical protein